MKSSAEKNFSLEGIPVKLTRKAVKNINLRISQRSGDVLVSAPHSVPEAYILSFLNSKLDWICERQSAAKYRQKLNEQRFETGESHHFLGKPYPLKIRTNSHAKVTLAKESDTSVTYIELSCPESSSIEQRSRLLDQWYREELKRLLSDIVNRWCLALGTSVNEYRIKKMKTKWGTCNIQDRRIWLNLELIKYPIKCLEYVALHELVHLFERRHNSRFYGLVQKHMPDWQIHEAMLDRGQGHE